MVTKQIIAWQITERRAQHIDLVEVLQQSLKQAGKAGKAAASQSGEGAPSRIKQRAPGGGRRARASSAASRARAHAER